MSSFASRLKELREREGLSHDKAAKSIAEEKYTDIKVVGRHIRKFSRDLSLAEEGEKLPHIFTLLIWANALEFSDEETEEMVARQMAEKHNCGYAWEMWEMPANRVIQEWGYANAE